MWGWFVCADVLLEFYKYPAEHWIHLRTTNPIELTFATVRLRTKVSRSIPDKLRALSVCWLPSWCGDARGAAPYATVRLWN
jgi:transposase-like protein